LLIVFSRCVKNTQTFDSNDAAKTPFVSSHDVPWITAQEIVKIEALKKEYSSFVYGMPVSIEAYKDNDGQG
jgi:hypothetical protein